MGGGEAFFFLTPLLLNRMLPPPPPDSVGCVCISVPASIVENNIVRGNQPSVSVSVGGVGIKCCRFCYGMLVLACFTELNPRSQMAPEGREMTLGGWEIRRWPVFLVVLAAVITIIITVTTTHSLGGNIGPERTVSRQPHTYKVAALTSEPKF